MRMFSRPVGTLALNKLSVCRRDTLSFNAPDAPPNEAGLELARPARLSQRPPQKAANPERRGRRRRRRRFYYELPLMRVFSRPVGTLAFVVVLTHN